MCIMGSINISLHEALPERSERGRVCVCVCVGGGGGGGGGGEAEVVAKLPALLVYQKLDPIQTEGEGDGSTCADFTLTLIVYPFNRITAPPRKLQENCRKNNV